MIYSNEFIASVEELEISVSNLLKVLRNEQPLNAAMYDVEERANLISQEWLNKYHKCEFEHLKKYITTT